MPEECASIRSIARWVLPVLVGPSTAVTPAPGARSLANARTMRREGHIFWEFLRLVRSWSAECLKCVHNATHAGSRLKLWNESGTNCARIADSMPVRLRSPQHLALSALIGGTRSSLTALDKRRFGGEFLKVLTACGVESEARRVNGIRRLCHCRASVARVGVGSPRVACESPPGSMLAPTRPRDDGRTQHSLRLRHPRRRRRW